MHEHIPVGTRRIVAITNSVHGTAFKKYSDLEQKMFEVKERLHAQWLAGLATGTPDFSVYHDPEYDYEGINCFEKSKGCTGGSIVYFQKVKQGNVINRRTIDTRVQDGIWYDGVQPSEMSVLDVYNGIGLTTVHMALNGFKNIESFNDCEPQIKYMDHAAKYFGLPKIKNHVTIPRKKFDLVLSFEVLEHYTDPLLHVADLLKLVKPGGYLAESSGFNGTEENIGHFETYTIDGQEVPYREARRITTRAIERHFVKVFDGYNRMPKIWKRNHV